MAVVESHAPGSFCWFELAASDWKAARAFYGSLFGWTAKELPMGEGEAPYIELQLDGKSVAALYQGGPPAWTTYISVASADESARKARHLGGSVVNEPFDVFDNGRMAIVRDPQGGSFCVWQARSHHGVSRMMEPGTVCWSELHTKDPAAAKAFYSALFGWSMKESPDYAEIVNQGNAIGGIVQSRASRRENPFWLTYIAVEDCDAAAARARSLGATIHVGPMDIENVGRFAIVLDPEGADFAIIAFSPSS
jgi:uncharacterized protein